MRLYAYCLSDELRGGMLEDVAGVSDRTPRLLEFGLVAVAVSDFEGERVTVERENVFAHERVVQRVLRHVTPLPFRFGTLSTREKLSEYVEANRARLIESLERVRGSVEMSVKIIWDTAASEKEMEDAGGKGEDEAEATGKGAAYLAARRRALLGDELRKERAVELGEWLGNLVGDAAVDSNVEVRALESMVVRAAFLVRREWLDDYQERINEARVQRSDLRFLTSGPWPPYSFSYINP
ncbi:MAG: GvpL/GvpF family gas vesicle protein [Pyrinomonadaceae bacterium]|nr:GvpL/GvpF family gas vesicle protein [Pyrinomonadaceae bacterium]